VQGLWTGTGDGREAHSQTNRFGYCSVRNQRAEQASEGNGALGGGDERTDTAIVGRSRPYRTIGVSGLLSEYARLARPLLRTVDCTPLMAERVKAGFVEPMLLLRTEALPDDPARWSLRVNVAVISVLPLLISSTQISSA